MLDEYAVLRMRRAELAEAAAPGRRFTSRAGRPRPTRPATPPARPAGTSERNGRDAR